MSYNLAFWRGGDDLDATETYRKLWDSTDVEGVDAVDRSVVTDAFAERLPGWGWDGQFLAPPGVDLEDGSPVFDVTIGAQMVEFVGYGMTGDAANAIIDAVHPLGYRLYDPQTDERYG